MIPWRGGGLPHSSAVCLNSWLHYFCLRFLFCPLIHWVFSVFPSQTLLELLYLEGWVRNSSHPFFSNIGGWIPFWDPLPAYILKTFINFVDHVPFSVNWEAVKWQELGSWAYSCCISYPHSWFPQLFCKTFLCKLKKKKKKEGWWDWVFPLHQMVISFSIYSSAHSDLGSDPRLPQELLLLGLQWLSSCYIQGTLFNG